MKQKKWLKRAISGMLTAVTLLTTAMSPMIAGAAELSADEELAAYVKSLPVMEAVADQLDSGEIVQAEAYEVEIGSEVDLKSDFTEISFNKEKIKVSFFEAENEEGQAFTTSHADTYEAVYYAEPVSGHPAYQFSRSVIVKEPEHKETQVSEEHGTNAGAEEESSEESEDADPDLPDSGKESVLSEEEFNSELKKTEDQETVDPETGVSLSEVMKEAVDQGIVYLTNQERNMTSRILFLVVGIFVLGIVSLSFIYWRKSKENRIPGFFSLAGILLSAIFGLCNMLAWINPQFLTQGVMPESAGVYAQIDFLEDEKKHLQEENKRLLNENSKLNEQINHMESVQNIEGKREKINLLENP